MSMIAEYRQVTPEELEKLLKDPEQVEELIFGGKDDMKRSPNGNGRSHLCLEKSWHGMHFLLTGDPWHGSGPLANAVLGGTEFGEDIGYGPPRYLTLREVKEVAAELATLTQDELKARFDPEAFRRAEIYAFHPDHAQDEFESLMTFYKDLCDFFQNAATANRAVLLYLT